MVWVAAAIVFVALLVLFPRAVGYMLLGVAILGVGAGGYLWWSNASDSAAAEKVIATLRYDTTGCQRDFPVFVGFVNRSARTVKSIYFGVTIRRKGYSNTVGSLPSLTQDKILGPGEGFGWCYAMPDTSIATAPSDLEFETTFKYITWK
jgi:hypothetical protein